MKSSANSQSNLWHLVLIALGVVMTFQIIRVFVTSLVYAFGERYGQTLSAIPALIVFLSPFLIPLFTRLLNPHRLFIVSVGGLAIVRLLMQISRDINLNLIFAGVAIIFALTALALLFSWSSTTKRMTPYRLAQAILLGMTLESALHGAFLTWDYIWQPGLIPLLTATIVSGLTLFALWQVRNDSSNWQPSEPQLVALLPFAALGSFFVLEMLFFQNIAFVASSSATTMEVAMAVVFLGNAIGFVMLGLLSQQPLPVRIIAGIALVVVAAMLPIKAGVSIIALVLVGHTIATGLLTSALEILARENTRAGISSIAVAVGLGSLLFIVVTILYYISTLITLPFSYTTLPPFAAFIILLSAFVSSKRNDAPNFRFALVPLALLVIPLLLFVTRPAIQQSTVTNSFRLLDYNTHQALTFDGWLDPEGLAQFIETEKPDVIALQEISRGWLIAGSLDVAEWLSRRLQMPYVYAPGHDYQFGNMIMTRMPITEWSFTRLPLRNVPLGRTLLQIQISLENGKTLTMINTHLSAYAATESRIPQVQKVIQTWNRAPRTLIMGDMNARPGEEDIVLFLNAGLSSAQDVAGDPNTLTFTSGKPVERIDWIFGTSEISFSDFKITQTQVSDHFPLLVNVTVR